MTSRHSVIKSMFWRVWEALNVYKKMGREKGHGKSTIDEHWTFKQSLSDACAMYISWCNNPLDMPNTIFYILYIHKHNFPLAVPAAIQSFVWWNCATEGTAVIPSPPSWANCCPSPVYTSTKRFMFPMTKRWILSAGWSCHCARRLWGHKSV